MSNTGIIPPSLSNPNQPPADDQSLPKRPSAQFRPRFSWPEGIAADASQRQDSRRGYGSGPCRRLDVRDFAARWALIVLAILCVWVAEAINTAIEFLVDLASPEAHPLAGKAKDAAAGAVLVAAIGAALIGGLRVRSAYSENAA